MRTTHVILCLFLAMICTQALSQRTSAYPSIYPGAVRQFESNQHELLSKDSYEKVRAFYAREKGGPTTERNVGEKGKSAWFKYMDYLPDDLGLNLLYATTQRSNALNNVFRRLEEFVQRDVIDRAKFDEIKKQYEYLHHYFYVQSALEDGRKRFMDEIIYRKYSDKMSGEGLQQKTMEEYMAEIQQLMMEGKMQEGRELAEKMRDVQMDGLEKMSGPEGVEVWVECLKEIEKNAYPVKIQIIWDETLLK
jgi:hypothetical protein